MSRHRRGRITVQNQPTGATRAMLRLMGVVHGVMGFTFVMISLTEIIPNAGLFGLPFLAGGAFFAINGLRMVFSKNDLSHRVGYDIETDVQQETIVGLMDDVDEMIRKEPSSPVHVGNGGTLDAKERLEQLKTLKGAGLIDEKEYQQKRQEILEGL